MMMFQTDKNTLVNVVDTVFKAVSKSSNNPSLECFYISVKDGEVTFKATNLEITIETSISAMIYENGETLVEAKLFTEFVKKLPNDTVVINQENNSLKISCKKSNLEISTTDTKAFPKTPEIIDGKSYVIAQKALKDALLTTAISLSQDESRPILTGMLIEIEDNKLTTVSLDGYRLSIKSTGINATGKITAVVPGRSITEIIKLLKSNDENVTVSFTKNHVMFDMGTTKIISTQLNGEFINYKGIIPSSYTSKVSVIRDDLLESIDRAALISAKSNTNLVKLEIKQNKMFITSNTAMGKGFEEVAIELEGEDLQIAFNSKFLLEMLKVVDEDIIIYFGKNVEPAIVKNKDNEDSYLYLTLPVRLVEW